jgi:hypothetical protein
MVIQMTEALIRVEYYSTDLLITPLGIRPIQILLSEVHVGKTQDLQCNRVTTTTIDNIDKDDPSHETKDSRKNDRLFSIIFPQIPQNKRP